MQITLRQYKVALRTGAFVVLAAFLVSAGLDMTLFGVGVAQAQLRGSSVSAPKFEVDPMWPKPLPNHWIVGSVVGVSADADDHIWIVHDGTPTVSDNERRLDSKTANCCAVAPPVLEFDQAGNLLRHWGGPGAGYEWPTTPHAITIDYKGNIWIGGSGVDDSQLLKFTKDGKFLLQVGRKGARRKPGAPAGEGEGASADFAGGSNDEVSFGRVAKVIVDPETNEAYVADGYLNKRVAVLDADTGKFKRHWGGYGNQPNDAPLGKYDPSAPPAKQFRNPVHCVAMSVDRLLYVCDRTSDRIQVFTPSGNFLQEGYYDKNTQGSGSVWDIAFSKDAQQRYIYVADGTNQQIKVIERRSLTLLTTFGDGGRQPGEFYGVHSITTDSSGNIFTTETWEGKRVQKFVYKGVSSVPRVQGVVWPMRRGVRLNDGSIRRTNGKYANSHNRL